MDKVIVIRHSDSETKDNRQTVEEKPNYVLKYIEAHNNHFSKALCQFACSKMVNSDKSNHRWTPEEVQSKINELGLQYNDTSNIYDVTYTANMAYADFYPEILDIDKCIRYAVAVANDLDGYEGIQFSRWMADVRNTNLDIDWSQMI